MTGLVHVLVEALEAFERVGLARALVGADALEARDAQGVAGAVARGLLYVLEVNLDDDLRLDLHVVPARRGDQLFEPRREIAQGLFRKSRADLADGQELAFRAAHGDD